MTGNHTIRNYQEGDEEGITALFKEIFDKEITVEQWRWKYLGTGRGRIFSKVVEDPSGSILGHAGAIPLRGGLQNNTIRFFQIADVMIHPLARGYLGKKNVFASLMKRLFEDISRVFPEAFCYGFPGERPYLFGERVGVYERIETATVCMKKISSSFFNRYRINNLPWDDERLDALWAGYAKDLSLSLTRDKEYLNWRYATNPFFTYQLLGIFLKEKLCGWAITREQGDEVLIVDLLTNRKKCRPVLKALENFLNNCGKKSIRLWLPHIWRNNIKGFKKEETELVVTNMVWKLPVSTSFAHENLFYTMGDTDML
jgi:hypothetical protein